MFKSVICSKRYRVAKLLGWRFHREGSPSDDFGAPRGYYWRRPDGRLQLTHRTTGYPLGGEDILPNPFEDVRDDFAVLRWVRGRSGWLETGRGCRAWGESVGRYEVGSTGTLVMRGLDTYELGDWAEAAIKTADAL